MLHGAGPALRTYVERANTWQRLMVALALIAAGAVLVTLGHIHTGLIGILGVVLLWGIVRHRRGRSTDHSPAGRADGKQP